MRTALVALLAAAVLAGCVGATEGEGVDEISSEATASPDAEVDDDAGDVEGAERASEAELAEDAEAICADAVELETTVDARNFYQDEARQRYSDEQDRSALRRAINDFCGDEIRTIGRTPAAESAELYNDPQPGDFALEVNVLEMSCFGSAGCNVTFRVELGYLGMLPLDPDAQYEVTYEVLGGEDPKINTLTVEGEMYSTDDRERIGIASSDDELTAEVVNVRAR